MLNGLLLLESLDDRGILESLRVTATERWPIPNPEPFQPSVWTATRFVEDEDHAEALMQRIADALKPAWYVNASTGDEVFVAFRGRLFRYAKGDAARRVEIVQYGLGAGVPLRQLDWPE